MRCECAVKDGRRRSLLRSRIKFNVGSKIVNECEMSSVVTWRRNSFFWGQWRLRIKSEMMKKYFPFLTEKGSSAYKTCRNGNNKLPLLIKLSILLLLVRVSRSFIAKYCWWASFRRKIKLSAPFLAVVCCWVLLIAFVAGPWLRHNICTARARQLRSSLVRWFSV